MASFGQRRGRTRFNLSELDIKEDENWNIPAVAKELDPPPSTHLLNPIAGKTVETMVTETWDVPMVNHSKATSISHVEDKLFQSFLNRQNVFGKCKHKDTAATNHNCDPHKLPFLTCQDCSSFLGCKECPPTLSKD